MSPKRKAAPSTSGMTKRTRKTAEKRQAAPSTSGMTKRTRKTAKETPEKRLARFVPSPSKAVMERIQRAFQHRLYLIAKKMIASDEGSPSGCEFYVLGATGNVYTVKLETKPSCTCPDAAKGHTCKHILFVMLRVLKLPQSDPRVWQRTLLSSELDDLVQISATHEGVLASQTVRQRFLEITGKVAGQGAVGECKTEAEKGVQRIIEGDCPVCYESMAGDGGKAKEPILFCKACGNNVHRDCFDRWSRSKRSAGGKVTCIYCRAEWLENMDQGNQNLEVDSGGYVNLASYSESHVGQDNSLEALYPDSWEWLGRRRRR